MRTCRYCGDPLEDVGDSSVIWKSQEVSAENDILCEASPTTEHAPLDVIDIGEARRIASEWHGGMFSPLYMFSSSGCVRDRRYSPSDIVREVDACLSGCVLAKVEDVHGEELNALRTFLLSLPAQETKS